MLGFISSSLPLRTATHFAASSALAFSKPSSHAQFTGLPTRCKLQGHAMQRTSQQLVMKTDKPISVPIQFLPSGVLLVLSSIFAIASIGSVFELSSGRPQYGSTITTGILVGSLPLFAFLFYAALQKGKAEAEED